MWKPNPECNTKFVEIKNKPATIMGLICEYCKRCQKNQRLLWELYAGIATNEECQQLFVTHMRVLQEMPKKPTAIMGTICGYCNEWRMSTTICDPYVGIARDAKKTNGYYGIYMRVLHIWKSSYEIYNRKWCRYYMFKMCVLF